MNPTDLIDINEVAERFGVKPITVRKWRALGLIQAHLVGRYWLFSEEEIKDFVKPAHGGGRPRKEKSE